MIISRNNGIHCAGHFVTGNGYSRNYRQPIGWQERFFLSLVGATSRSDYFLSFFKSYCRSALGFAARITGKTSRYCFIASRSTGRYIVLRSLSRSSLSVEDSSSLDRTELSYHGFPDYLTVYR